MKYFTCTSIVLSFAAVAHLATPTNGSRNLEDDYVKKFGNDYNCGRTVHWCAGSLMSSKARKAVCEKVHTETGFGTAVIRSTEFQEDGPVKFQNSKYGLVNTGVLKCIKAMNNYTYYVTQGTVPNSVIILRPSQNTDEGKNVYVFSRIGLVPNIRIPLE